MHSIPESINRKSDRPLKAVIFDLDGTLLDTLNGLVATVNHILRAHGAPERTRDEIRSFLGNGQRRLIASALPSGESFPDFESIVLEYRDWYEAHATEGVSPYPGIPELLSTLRARGIALGVVTNKDEGAARALIEHFFPGVFGIVAGGGEGRAPKPDPMVPRLAMNALGAKPDETLYVGDSDVDAATARAAGLPFLLCSWGFRPRGLLVTLGHVVDHAEEILRHVEGIARRE